MPNPRGQQYLWRLRFGPLRDKMRRSVSDPLPYFFIAMQVFEGRVCPPPEGYIVLVVAKFNKTITQRLLDGALAKLRQHKVRESDIRIVWVPGAYEIPYIANYFARDAECLAVICLGAVIKGDTSHDQHINRYVGMAIGEAAARFGTPVIFGVLTCDTVEQADARSGMIGGIASESVAPESVRDKVLNPAPGNKGAEAAEAALELIDLMTELPEIDVMSNLPNIPIPPGLARLLGRSDGDEDDEVYFGGAFEDDEDGGYVARRRKTAKKAVKKATKKKPKQ